MTHLSLCLNSRTRITKDFREKKKKMKSKFLKITVTKCLTERSDLELCVCKDTLSFRMGRKVSLLRFKCRFSKYFKVWTVVSGDSWQVGCSFKSKFHANLSWAIKFINWEWREKEAGEKWETRGQINSCFSPDLKKSDRKQLLETGLSYHLHQVTWECLLKVQLPKLHPLCSASSPLGERPMKQNS